MSNYISFMDLLGTKSIAISNPLRYRDNIEIFQKIIFDLAKDKNYSSIEMYVFSDCAYFESLEVLSICSFLRKLREKLLAHEICFNAAICKGQLKTNMLYEKDRKLAVIDFKSDEVVKVYSMQSCFSGAGIFVDSDLLKEKGDKGDSIRSITLKSVYQGFDKFKESYSFFEFVDVRFQRKSINLLEYILNLFIKCYILDKRASRYYYTLYVTYISEQDIDTLLENDMLIVKKIIAAAKKIANDHDKLVLIILLINRLYDAQIDKLGKRIDMEIVNEELDMFLSYIITKVKIDKLYNIKSIDEKILNTKNKFLFSEFCFNYNIDKKHIF